MNSKAEYYMLRISYTAEGWHGILNNSTSYDQRMEPVRNLIAHLGGSLASFQFYQHEKFQNKELAHSVDCKFAVFGGNDLMAILAMQTKAAAQAFKVALLSQPGIANIELVSIMPYADVINTSLSLTKRALPATKYAGPGPGRR